MKNIKVFVLLLIAWLTQMAVSCCDCNDSKTGYYLNKNLSLNHLDNSGIDPVVASDSVVNKEAYGIRVHLNRKLTACNTPTPSFFISSAYATSCDCPPEIQIFPRDSIRAIQLITINDFDAAHGSNSDITGYFKVLQQSTYTGITEFLDQCNQVLISENKPDLIFDAMLMNPPQLNASHSFKVRITLSDGRVLEETTTPVELN